MRAVLCLLLVSLPTGCVNHQQMIRKNLSATVTVDSGLSVGVGVVLQSSSTHSYILTVAHLCNPEIDIMMHLMPVLGQKDPLTAAKTAYFRHKSQSGLYCDIKVYYELNNSIQKAICKAELVDFDNDLILCKINQNLGANITIGNVPAIGDNLYLTGRHVMLNGEATIFFGRAGQQIRTPSIAHSLHNLVMLQTSFPVSQGYSGSPVFLEETHQLVGIFAKFIDTPVLSNAMHVTEVITTKEIKEFLNNWERLSLLPKTTKKCLGELQLCKFIQGHTSLEEFIEWLKFVLLTKEKRE